MVQLQPLQAVLLCMQCNDGDDSSDADGSDGRAADDDSAEGEESGSAENVEASDQDADTDEVKVEPEGRRSKFGVRITSEQSEQSEKGVQGLWRFILRQLVTYRWSHNEKIYKCSFYSDIIMAETISLEVQGKVQEELLGRLYGEVTPKYVRDLLAQNGMPTDEETVENVTTSYADGFPTRDLALKAASVEGGMKLWGIASGSASRPERMAAKYLILEHIQDELGRAGIQSELNIADLNPESVEYMEQRGMFRGKLPELRAVAEQRGNLENVTIGAYAAMQTPVSK